ncbi:MAG: hypothetical protein H4O13_00595 [Xanthomonadales bacterium]|jgi:hypothetical protein|nr:hypothetical protein [Xanthomonadales bacterium]
MRPLPLVAPLLVLLLGACSASREDLSFEACAASAKDATQRSRTYSESQKTSFKIDSTASRASTKSVEPGVFELRIVATINSEQGTPTHQDFLCRTRFTEGKELPDVIAFSFLLEGQ